MIALYLAFPALQATKRVEVVLMFASLGHISLSHFHRGMTIAIHGLMANNSFKPKPLRGSA
jgi:hypothetical protein